MAAENFQKPPVWLGIEALGLRAFLLLAAGVVIAAVLFWHVYETLHYRKLIPADIGLTFNFATRGSDVSLWGALFMFDRKACGGAIFDMSGSTADAIRKQGLNFFKDARQGRGYTEKGDRSFIDYSYQSWRATPLSPEWTALGPWPGLNCMGLRAGTMQNILNAAQKPGSFYATGQSKMLLVDPNRQFVLVTYMH
ncbi:MAG TPA: hypothetical protein VFB29_02260 [Pseudolabrys sp.]|nr:hypothetical protein [Pseudolabrys sp.]